jgi:hypothetical protein
MKKRRIPPAASQTSSPDALLGVPWTPFARCHPDPREPEVEIWLNSRYQVHLRRIESKSGGPVLVHLSFRRLALARADPLPRQNAHQG